MEESYEQLIVIPNLTANVEIGGVAGGGVETQIPDEFQDYSDIGIRHQLSVRPQFTNPTTWVPISHQIH